MKRRKAHCHTSRFLPFNAIPFLIFFQTDFYFEDFPIKIHEEVPIPLASQVSCYFEDKIFDDAAHVTDLLAVKSRNVLLAHDRLLPYRPPTQSRLHLRQRTKCFTLLFVELDL